MLRVIRKPRTITPIREVFMRTTTSNFSSISIDKLVDYVLTDSGHDPVFSTLDPIANIESQKIPSKNLKRKAIDCLESTVKKNPIEPSSYSPCPTTIPFKLEKAELIESMKQTYEQAKKCSLEKLHTYYADQFNVDAQEIENIYLAVSSCPTFNEISVIPTKLPLPITKNLIWDPTAKKDLVNSINQIFHRTNEPLEEIQRCFADRFNVDIQEIKKIYLNVSIHCPTVNETSVIPTKSSFLPAENTIIMTPGLKKDLVNVIDQIFDEMKSCSLKRIQTQYGKHFKLDHEDPFASHYQLKDLDLGLRISSTETTLLISPTAKKDLVDNITYLLRTTDKSLEEIQTFYADQFKITLQEIEDIYLAISNNYPSAHRISSIKQKTSMI